MEPHLLKSELVKSMPHAFLYGLPINFTPKEAHMISKKHVVSSYKFYFTCFNFISKSTGGTEKKFILRISQESEPNPSVVVLMGHAIPKLITAQPTFGPRLSIYTGPVQDFGRTWIT